ncbi:MAG TPA: aminotransferase class V-fold PLP-dependent enzyme [Bryobacteraceae bacterium]|nr:aminotransferase class V-fold PLP-dependent enzyme [Bryobacteraceae bacterium]
MSDKLALPADEFRAITRAAADFLASYYVSLDSRPVLVPTTSKAIRDRLDEPLPETGADFPTLLETLRDIICQYSRHSAHPRFFGYVSSPGTPITAVSSMIASALAINVTCWRSAPSGTDLEHLTIDWLKQMLGYPAEAAGLLTSGGSMANFAALGAARSAKASANVVRDGVAAVGKRMCVYASEEAHYSISKAAGMLGLGESNVRSVKTDARLRMDLADLARLVDADLDAGHLPFCVAASAGTTATGAFDPLGDLADFARRHNLWLHVDAAYGGFAALAPSVRHLFARLGEADSVTLDPHKWLYLPVGCGCVLYKDPAAARAAFSHGADYTRAIGLERDEAFAFWDYGPELTRPFRALDLWMLIKFAGAARLGQAIERNIACAKYFEELANAADDFEMLAPVQLSIFCFRYVPKGFTGDLNNLNQRILVDLQRAGSTYLSNATIRGQFALRGCVLNYRTATSDMARVLEDVRKAAGALV